ncbi:MAG: Hsp20/alpha crystallin family protein [Thermoleophilia bacterium]
MNPRDKDEHSGFRRLQNEVDRMFLELMGTNRMVGQARTAFRPNVDVYFSKSASAMIVRLELGGVEPQSLDLQVEERVLRIRGHRLDHGHKEKVYQQMEIAYGPFERRILMPVDVDSEHAEAHYHQGFLEVVLPIAERSGSKRIGIVNRDEEDEARRSAEESPGAGTDAEGGRR